MSISDSKIRRILKTHQNLMVAYGAILSSLEEKDSKFYEIFFVENPLPYLNNVHIGYYEKIQLIFSHHYFLHRITILTTLRRISNLILSGFFKMVRKNKFITVVMLPTQVNIQYAFISLFVEFFIKTHIRKQLTKIYKIYAKQILFQNQNNESEINELREINQHIKDYTEDLPSIKKFFLTLIGVTGFVLTIIPLVHADTYIIKFFNDLISPVGLSVLIFIPYVVALITIRPLLLAFKMKRALFLDDTRSLYYIDDIYLDKGSVLLKKSIYKLEDDLWAQLSTKKKKPKEIPVDKILMIFSAGSIFILIIPFVFFTIMHLDSSPNSIFTIGSLMTLIFLISFYLIIVPLIEYRRRKTNQLL